VSRGSTPPVDIVIEEIGSGLKKTVTTVVPWFMEQMPEAYFRDTDHATRLSHLRAIIAARASGLPLRITLRSDDGHAWTFINDKDYPGLLARLVRSLPTDEPLRSAKVHTSSAGDLVLVTIAFGESSRFDPKNAAQTKKRDDILAYAKGQGLSDSLDSIRKFLEQSCTADYVLTVTPLRSVATWKRFAKISGTDDVSVELEPDSDPTLSRIVMLFGNATPRRIFELYANHLGMRNIDIRRAYLDVFNDPGNGEISVLTYVVTHPGIGAIDPAGSFWKELRSELMRVKWAHDGANALAQRRPDLGVIRAEVIFALFSLAHQILTRENPYVFARDRVLQLAERYIDVAEALADVFLARFDPEQPLDDEAFAHRAAQLKEEIDRSIDPEDARRVMATIIEIMRSTMKTNVHLDERYALSLRLDPALMMRADQTEKPFGVFFVHGHKFDGFHVRFRDIARGGVRVVKPSGAEQYALETDRLYDEVYGLAQAQQLKNKDIPEGGAKAVILVTADANVARSVKAFTDSLLDLLVHSPELREKIVDRLGFDEALYLGPDENISSEMIEWIVARAARRGYPLPNAFMSSKPGAGINHKEYGVTSEGVTVFLEVALKAVGIDPRSQSFTVKITGGPDGDVAGNEIKILHREYGERAKIVGIADGSGCGEDPDGLDHGELLRLVAKAAAIGEFDRKKLGPRGKITLVSEPGGVKLRNTLHNRVLADAFVPAGGRPKTIHGGNWREFLTTDGRASSRVIIEGANLFITPEARKLIAEHGGAVIVKDSSANKCGVICSSFEIAASMILSEQEFLSVKARFVEEVVGRLRQLARAEAELLFREHARNPTLGLPDLSVRVSRLMNRAAESIAAIIRAPDPNDVPLLRGLVREHLPKVLLEMAEDRIWNQMRPAYRRWMMASVLAAKIVYREGLDYLEPVPTAALGALALKYLRQERETHALIEALAKSDLAERDRIIELLERSGTRAALGAIE
jgi:glutamate dehydrogenase